MYLRRLFSDKKIRLVYSNALNQMNLSCSVNDGSNRTAYKTCLDRDTKTQTSQRRCRNKYCRRTIAKI